MTNEVTDPAVSAAPQQDEVSVSAEEEQIAQAVAGAVDAPVAEEQAELEVPSPLTAADLDTRLKQLESSLQGRTANWTAESFKALRESLTSELEGHLAPLREQASLIEQSRVQQMEPEDQVDYWREKATQQAQPAPAAVSQAPSVYSETDVSHLRGKVEGMLSGIGLDVDPQDDRLWAGARVGASIDDLFAVARRNAQGLLPQPKTAAAPAPTRPRVPSTTGAPKRAGQQLNSRTEIAEALQAGTINSDQARAFTRSL